MSIKHFSVEMNNIDPKRNYRIVKIRPEEELEPASEIPDQLIVELEKLKENFKSRGFVIKTRFFKATVRERFILLPQVYTGAEVMALAQKLESDRQALAALRAIPNIPKAVIDTMMSELQKNPVYNDCYIIPIEHERDIYKLITQKEEDKIRTKESLYSKLADWLVGELNLRGSISWQELVEKSRIFGIPTLATDDDLRNAARLSNFKTALKRETGLRLRFRDGIVTKE